MAATVESVVVSGIDAEVTTYLRALGVPEPQLTPMHAGCHNKVYHLGNAADVCTAQEAVVRVSTCPEAARATMANAAYLEGTPAPRIEHMGNLALSGSLIVIEERIQGDRKDLSSQDPGKLARAVASIHERTSSCFSGTAAAPPLCSGTYGDYLSAMLTESVMGRLRNGSIELSCEARDLVVAGMDRLYGLISARPSLFSDPKRRFSLLHHDLNPDNMLWRADGSVRFIDWNTTFGDPADDVDYVVTNNDVTPGFKEAFLVAYEHAMGRSDVIERVGAYTLKNQLDDLVWVLDMQRRCPDDVQYGQEAYEKRLVALISTLMATPELRK